nr:MAG TPA: Chromatin remodeling complex ATPase [Caudoviricetes sp.]
MQTMSKGFGFLFEMGCGKTLTAIATMGTAYQLGKIEKVLIIAPTSVCSVWPKEFEEYADFKVNVKVMQGEKDKRIKALSDLDSFPFKALKVAVINYESTWRDGIFEALQAWNADMIICDESQRIKTHDAEQSKAIHKLGDQARYKLILSGTPVQNNAIDLYSQYRFLDPTIFGTNFYQFRNRYAIMGGFNRHQIVGYRDLDKLIQKEHSIAYRVTKDEALDLPEQTFLERRIVMSAKEKSIYDRLKRESFTELDGGGQITVTTVLTKLLRLQQYTGGFLIADGKEKPELVSKGKLNALEEIVDDYVLDAGKKLVIFARFRPEIDLIGQMLDKKKIKYGAIYGDVKLESRGDIVKDFQTNPKTMVFLAQIDTAGLGITLTAADTCVYYSVNFNYAAYSQSLARIHRIGQKNICTYIHLITEKTVDETILKALAKKEDLAKTIVDEWRNYF